MTDSVLRMAAVDYSHNHQYAYTRAMLELPMVELVALAESNDQRRTRAADLVAQANQRVDVYDDYHRILARDDIQAVIICSPTVDHYRMILDAARSGKHVLCEKPLTLSVAEADDAIAVCQEEGVSLGTAYPCRFSPVMWEIKQRIEAGEIGDILAMSTTNRVRVKPIQERDPGVNWMMDPQRSGGGCIRDHIVHCLDLCRWFSDREPVEVYAEAGTLAMPRILVEDTAVLLVVFEGGLVGTIDPSKYLPRAWPRWGDVAIRIAGTKGTVDGDSVGQVIWRTTDTAKWLSYDEDMNYYLIKNFAESVLADHAPLVTGWDGRMGVATTVAAYESVRTHSYVHVEGLRRGQ
jgi:predicted dehydrogenase